MNKFFVPNEVYKLKSETAVNAFYFKLSLKLLRTNAFSLAMTGFCQASNLSHSLRRADVLRVMPRTRVKVEAYVTKDSQTVTHPSTNQAQCFLTSVIRQELVCSTSWFGRKHPLSYRQTQMCPTTLTNKTFNYRMKDWKKSFNVFSPMKTCTFYFFEKQTFKYCLRSNISNRSNTLNY